MMRGAGLLIASMALVLPGCFSEVPVWPGEAPALDAVGPDQDPATDGPVPLVDMGDGAVDGPPDASPLDLGPPPPERCNGIDDDRDGVIDEGFPLGGPCSVGQGACVADGVQVCARDGMGVACNAEPGRPSLELCNGIDDDCSGVVDEDFPDVGDDCVVGEGVCLTEGHVRCTAAGAGTECSVVPADERRTLETCNGVDDDCDGRVDNGLVRSCATALPGLCAEGTSACVAGEWTNCEGMSQPGDRRDVCNGLDDDCDNGSDEDDLPDGPVPCADVACIPLGGCLPRTPCVRQCDPDSDIGAICAWAPETQCDGVDDDCDGVIDDDGVCGVLIANQCKIGLGWTTRALPSPSPEWGDCDINVGGLDDDISCNGTRPGTYSTISLAGDLDAGGDALGVAFRCDAGPTGDYIASHCRVFLGVSAAGAEVADGAAAWGPCPAEPTGGDDTLACTASTRDGGFQPMPLPFDLGVDTLMGVAFICEDADDPARALAVQSSVAVSLGWADGPVAQDVVWSDACRPMGDGNPYSACARTRGDARFRAMRLTADVDGGDELAIRLGLAP